MTGSEFRSMIFTVQYEVPTYNRWLLDEADLAPAYRWHRLFLEHLQSGHMGERWLLKSPAHLWHLAALLAEYPDAVIIQTHRDPLKVIASVSALAVHLRRMASDSPSLPAAADAVRARHLRRARPRAGRPPLRPAAARRRWSTCSSPTSWPTRSPPSPRSTTGSG